jgi:hypothetical protein
LQTVWQAVETFRGEAEQQDDMTLVVIAIDSKAASHADEQTDQVPERVTHP